MHVLLLKVIYLYDFHFYYPENSWYVQITIVKSDNTHSNISRIFCEILCKFIASWHFNVIFLFWVVKLEHNICISCLFHLKMKNCTRVLLSVRILHFIYKTSDDWLFTILFFFEECWFLMDFIRIFHSKTVFKFIISCIYFY